MKETHQSLLSHSISIAKQLERKLLSVKKKASFHSALHSIQKPVVKQWKKSELHTQLPQPPPPPKVYFVEPRRFRELVQMLTGSPKRPLKETVQPPPPLELASPPLLSTFHNSATAGTEAEFPSNVSKGVNSPNSGLDGFSTPPFYSNWCSFPLLSPASIYGDSRT